MVRKDTGQTALNSLLRDVRTLDDAVFLTTTATLWVDPGESTGWAIVVTPFPFIDPASRLTPGMFYSGQSHRVDALCQIDAIIDLFGFRLSIGWEDYLHGRGAATFEPTPLKVIGVLEHLCTMADVPPVVLTPQPSSARALGTLHLATMGWHKPGERDANAAAEHLSPTCS